jgi:hypothetical protein
MLNSYCRPTGRAEGAYKQGNTKVAEDAEALPTYGTMVVGDRRVGWMHSVQYAIAIAPYAKIRKIMRRRRAQEK